MSDELENTNSSESAQVPETPVSEPTAVTPEVVESESPSEADSGTRLKCKLDLLPDNMKKVLHELIAQGEGAVRTKKALEDRFLGKTTLLPATIKTYHTYIREHKEEILKRVELEKSLVETTKESVADMKELLNADPTKPIPLDNKKKALERLFERVQTRVALLETKQNGFFDAQYETIIGAYFRELRTIVEKMVEYQAELRKDTSDQLYDEFENLVYSWVVSVFNIYKQIHGDTKFLEFKNLMNEEIPKVIAGYRQKREEST